MPRQSQETMADETRRDSLPVLLTFAIPTVLALLSTSVYHLADARFVSSLDAASSAAIGVAFPLQVLFQAVGFTFGTGGGCLVSASLGAGRRKDASHYASLSLISSLFTGIAIGLVGSFLLQPLAHLLGASGETVAPAVAYLRYLLPSAPFLCASPALAQLLRAKGHPWRASAGLCSGNLFNILLDPLLIRTLSLGIAGASLATLIGQGLGFVYLLCLAHRSEGEAFRLRELGGQLLKHERSILLRGAPSMVRQGFLALSTLLLNRIAAEEGIATVTAMSVVNRLFLLGFAFCAGVAQGATPLIGYHYGGGRTRAMQRTVRRAVFLSSALMLGLAIPLLLFTQEILSLFHADAAAIAVGTRALRAQALVFVLHGVITCTTLALQAVGKNGQSLLLAGARQGIFLLPLLAWIPARFGRASFIYAQPVADLLTFLLSLPFLILLLRRGVSVRRPNSRGMPSPHADKRD